MPHGLSVDKDGNYWVTDVALHQVTFHLALIQTELNGVPLLKCSRAIWVFSVTQEVDKKKMELPHLKFFF